MKRLNTSVSKIAMALMLIFVITSCDLFDLDINKDPNNPTEVTPDLLLPSVIVNASATFGGGLNSNTHGFVGGNIASADGYGLSNTSYVGTWSFLYTGPLKDLDEVIKFCTKAGNLPRQLGVAQILKAYYFSMMVDLWGDVPFKDAFNANNAEAPNQSPSYDDGASIYAACFALLEEGKANLAKASSEPLAAGDPIYGSSPTAAIEVSRWIKAANSIKLRMLINTRLVGGFDNANQIAALKDVDLITSTADDFQFQFGRLQAPDDRHPWYQAAYTGAENGYNYLGHQLMFEMFRNGDPRLPFYIKRQTTKILNFDDPTERSTAPCTQTVGCFYGYMVKNTGSGNIWSQLQATTPPRISTPPNASDLAYLAGLFGRDRADNAGVPLDGTLRAAPGVYPAGGFYDDGGFNADGSAVTARQVNNNKGFGNGIFPMVTSWMVKFYRIEAILAMGVGGTLSDARTMYEAAIREHIAKVVSFGQSLDNLAIAPSSAAIESYVSSQMALYDGVASNEGKLRQVLKQAWFTNFGNGFEQYNAYRRTGYPDDIKPPIAPTRNFALRLPYSLDDLTLNANAEAQKAIVFDVTPVFWDK